MINSDTVIISPSGNFYGSEQVLYDFLLKSENEYTVYVPGNGRFIQRLRSLNRHNVKAIGSNIKLFYIELFWLLWLGRYKSIYVNEGAHIRYIKMLASFFRRKKFIVHIRITEDTSPSRIGALPENVILICISQYIRNLINDPAIKNIQTIYDLYVLGKTNGIESKAASVSNKIKIGVIGRVTNSKGLKEIITFCDFLEHKSVKNIEINFFGDVEKELPDVLKFLENAGKYKNTIVKFHGFQENKDAIYSSIDLVIHLNKLEPLGRIFLESLDYGVPIIGFNEGGIGEMAKLLKLEDCMVNNDENWTDNLYYKIVHVKDVLNRYSAARKKMDAYFSATSYCEQVEAIIA
jgi:glycosyltransferase involved in cell wall biosynthesis